MYWMKVKICAFGLRAASCSVADTAMPPIAREEEEKNIRPSAPVAPPPTAGGGKRSPPCETKRTSTRVSKGSARGMRAAGAINRSIARACERRYGRSGSSEGVDELVELVEGEGEGEGAGKATSPLTPFRKRTAAFRDDSRS